MTDRPYSVATLAERWECSRRHIMDMINAGDLRHFRLGAKLLRIPAGEVQRWENENGETIESGNTGSATSRAKAARYGMKVAAATATGSELTKKSRRDLRLMRSLDDAKV